MHLLTVLLSVLALFHREVLAELSVTSCDLLHTATSMSNVIPEVANLAMRYYHASSFSPAGRRRQKRLVPAGTFVGPKGSVAEQMIANAIRDVNFTNAAIMILNNNQTMNKIRNNVDTDVVVRMIMREINYEKLLGGLWSAAEKDFDLEHFVDSIIQRSRLDVIHDELFRNGTLPEWFVQSIHPNLTVQTVERILSTIRNATHQFVQVLSKSERFDNYLFNLITQQAITPLNNIVQGVKNDKPKTFPQLIDIIVSNINRVSMVSLIEVIWRRKRMFYR